MKKLITIILVSVRVVSSAQTSSPVASTPTGGCYGGYTVGINSIVEDWATVFTLVNGHKYSLNVSLTTSMEDCQGNLEVILKNKTTNLSIGGLNYITKGDFKIPLDSFNVPPGIYDLTAFFHIRYPASATTKVSIVETTGVVDLSSTGGFSIFPLPANTDITIAFKNTPQHFRDVTLLDINGRLVRTRLVENGNGSVNLPVADLACGMYILRATNDESVLYRKIIIQH